MEGHGIPIYDWMKVKKEGGRNQVNVQLMRQMMSATEVGMMVRAVKKNQDFVVVAARGLMRSSMLDDVLRRSFKSYLEHELGIKMYVWMMSIRHNDERGNPKDEGVMVGLVSENGGKKLGEGLKQFQGGSKKCMMLVEGTDVQLFREGRSIWNTTKPVMMGRSDKTIEVLAPKDKTTRDVLDVLREVGINQVHMMARITKVGKESEMWAVVPLRGETFNRNKVMIEGKEWTLSSYDRAPEVVKTEQGSVCWNMGIKISAPVTEDVGENDNGTISTITTSVGTFTSGKQSEEGRMTTSRGAEDIGRLREEICEVLKKDREEMREELEGRLAEDRKALKDMMDAMMKGISEVGLRMRNNNDDK